MTAEKQSRIHRIMIRAAIGATIGGCTASAWVAITTESRFFFDTLAVLGTGGLIGGAICGVIIGAFGGKIGLAIAGIIGGMGGCVLAVFVTFLYTIMPWPAPKPYPGVEVEIHSGGGSQFASKGQTYTVTRSLDDVQRHYEKQMRRYCESDWQFKESSDPGEYALCRWAECEIRRLWMEQYFSVELCSVSETQTIVIHIDSWED